MDLLVFKDGEKYLRFIESSFEYSDMNKASVFPISDLENVKEKFNKLRSELKELSVKKLTITESDYL